MMASPRYGDHLLESRKNDVIEEAAYLFRRLAYADRRADLRAVTAITGSKLHDGDVAIAEYAPRWTRIAENQRGIFHRRRSDDREVHIASAFEDSARRSGFELIFGYAGTAARRQSLHRRFTEFARFADTLKLLFALLVNQLVHEARLEAERRIRKSFS